MYRTVILAALCLVLASNAEARQRHHVAQSCVETGSVMFPSCMGQIQDVHEARRVARGEATVRAVGIGTVRERASPRASGEAATQVVGGRPSGCPSAYCGCGASLHLFGRIIPSLNLAANWLRFPRAAPAPRMAAARRGHVMVLEEHIAGDMWLVHDSNSGGHATRLHARSIAGYTIVDPHGAG